jgi:hypothetical protein
LNNEGDAFFSEPSDDGLHLCFSIFGIEEVVCPLVVFVGIFAGEVMRIDGNSAAKFIFIQYSSRAYRFQLGI